jgi:hypothetical protein
MSRAPAATLIGIVFFLAYIAAAVTLADHIPHHWAIQAGYFVLAGVLWVIPIRWLMLWSVHKL